MYRANFYNHHEFGSPRFALPSSPIAPAELLGKEASSFAYPLDSFSTYSRNPFGHQIRQQLGTISRLEMDLKKRLSPENKNLTAKTRKEVMERFSALENAKKMIAYLVEQMQKTQSSIAANFR